MANLPSDAAKPQTSALTWKQRGGLLIAVLLCSWKMTFQLGSRSCAHATFRVPPFVSTQFVGCVLFRQTGRAFEATQLQRGSARPRGWDLFLGKEGGPIVPPANREKGSVKTTRFGSLLLFTASLLVPLQAPRIQHGLWLPYYAAHRACSASHHSSETPMMHLNTSGICMLFSGDILSFIYLLLKRLKVLKICYKKLLWTVWPFRSKIIVSNIFDGVSFCIAV